MEKQMLIIVQGRKFQRSYFKNTIKQKTVMNYINIGTDNVEELNNLRNVVVSALEGHDEDEIFYQKLSEDLWDLDDKINRIENK